jgi:hypothetical protein
MERCQPKHVEGNGDGHLAPSRSGRGSPPGPQDYVSYHHGLAVRQLLFFRLFDRREPHERLATPDHVHTRPRRPVDVDDHTDGCP